MRKKTNTGMILEATAPYPLHLLGWSAFQDLAISIAEVCLQRPVQNFLPGNDAGRDGAFIGRWDHKDGGKSTIQCKHTSRPGVNLTLSILSDELTKIKRLIALGEADDYIIITNHPVTGQNELQIKTAFKAAGVKDCRIFGAEWINRQIRTSSKLRMSVPRLYGLGDLHDVLDTRAYEQADLILSSMGDDLQRLVVTDAHRQSVRAISEHNLVLLLGAPAAGKSTIGASIAVGAADRWGCNTIRATSPEETKDRIDPKGGQFFWIDDAWGSKQYQKQTAESWNKIFPLMHSAMRKGTRFLITSRDYIWRSARNDLKLSALPALNKSQVIIDVHQLTLAEKSQILYNHIKLGDQPKSFRRAVKQSLPIIAARDDFLPETARRLGSTFFADRLDTSLASLVRFFSNPRDFLTETLSGLSAEARAAIAVIFLNGGNVRSPIGPAELGSGSISFGVPTAHVREQFDALNGSVLLLARDELGPYWTYKHPTVGDAFSSYLANSVELIEIYLKGARPETILSEVVCAGVSIQGASLVVPASMEDLLIMRIIQVNLSSLKSFMAYRANKSVNQKILNLRPSVADGFSSFITPIKDDLDSMLLEALHRQELLSEETRTVFVKCVFNSLIEDADSSILEEERLSNILTRAERDEYRETTKKEVFPHLEKYVTKLKDAWNTEYPPDEYFYELECSIERLNEFTGEQEEKICITPSVDLGWLIRSAVSEMEEEYHANTASASVIENIKTPTTVDSSIFRDLDD